MVGIQRWGVYIRNVYLIILDIPDNIYNIMYYRRP